MANILIVYYSRKGENYWNGSIKSIAKGNTERVAEFIQNAVGGELFEVETVKPYSDSYIPVLRKQNRSFVQTPVPKSRLFLITLRNMIQFLSAIRIGGVQCQCVCSHCLKSMT